MNRIRVVFLKEMREVFRDKRTLFNLVLSPLLITPLLLLMVGNLTKSQVTQARKEKVTVGVAGAKAAPNLMQSLSGEQRPNIVFEEMTRPAIEEAIRKRTLKAGLLLPPDADTKLAATHPVLVTILYDEGRESSLDVSRRLNDLFSDSAKNITAFRLRDSALSAELAIPFDVKQEKIPGSGGIGMVFLFTLLPYMLAVYAIMGGVYMANDTVAGEKERGTLETLLVSPASRRDIVLGKFFAIVSVSLLSSVLSVIGILWPAYAPMEALQGMMKGVTITPLTLLAIMLVQIPLAVLGAGLLLIISTYARNQKEAQTYLAPVLLTVTVAAMMTMFVKAESNILFALVPVLNAGLVLKGALEATLSPGFVVLACAASLLYAGVAVAVAVGLFEKESVLLKA